MKANLKTTILPALTAAISCTLSLAAGATDNSSSGDNDSHFSSNFTPIVNDVRKAEALIYEPQANGKLRIVGVEYIVPKDAWDAANPPQAGLPSPRPNLLGHLLNFVDSP